MEFDLSGADDVVLLRRIASRDAAAVGDLYDRYNRLLFGIIVRILRSQADAEEVLQEVFVRVWARAEMYDARLGRPGAWLVRIARNRAIDRLRARRTSGESAGTPAAAEAPASSVATPEIATMSAEKGVAVRDALATLPEDQRLLIEAAFWEGYTHSELAARFGLPLGTVKTRIRAGMIRIRELLEQVA